MANGPVQVLPQRCRACTCANGYHPADCTDGEDEDAGFCEKWNNGEDTSDFLDGGTGGDAGAGDDGAGDEDEAEATTERVTTTTPTTTET